MGNPVIRRGWLRTLLYLLSLILTLLLFSIAGFYLISLLSGELPFNINLQHKENIHLLIILQLSIMAGVTLITFLFRKYIDSRELVTLGLQWYRVKKDALLGLITGLVCIAGGFVILYLSGFIKIDYISPDPAYLAFSFVLFILVSWIEEISFRGYILNNLMESFNPFVSLLISSLLFAFFHIFNSGLSVLGFTNLLLAGILLGIVFIYTRTIWFALSLHLFWNFFQGPVFGFRVSGTETSGLIRMATDGPGYITGGDFGLEGSLICSFLLLLSILLINHIHNNRFNKTLEKKY